MELKIPDEVARVLAEAAEDPGREALEALLLHLIREERVSVAWAGGILGLGRQEAIRWYTSHGYPFPDITPAELDEELRNAERLRTGEPGEQPRKPQGVPLERRVDVGGEPAAEAVSWSRGE